MLLVQSPPLRENPARLGEPFGRITFTLFLDETEKRDRFPGVGFAVRIISDLYPSEFFLQQGKETLVRLPPFLIAEQDLD